MDSPRLSVVVVTFNSKDDAIRTLTELDRQLGPEDELIVFDNGSSDGTPAAIEAEVPRARVVRNADNLGFAEGANRGAALARGELLVFLNPDALPAPGFVEAIAAPLREGRGWAGWMGLVTSEGGRAINTSGGVVHFTGVAFCGELGLPVETVPPEPREITYASGACLAVPRERWQELGGFPPEYFMYAEDVDLSLRLRLAGGRIGIEPRARVDHGYEFEKGPAKWRRLERNRLASVLRTYPTPLLLLVLPALAATELALVPISLVGGYARQKLLADIDLLRWLPRLLRERRAIQARRAVGAAEFAAALTPELDNPFLGRAARLPLLAPALRAYWRVVLKLLRA